MKKFIFILFCIGFFFANSTLYSSISTTYHIEDKEGLRMFLRQNSAVKGKLNLEMLHLNFSDTTSWYESEEWIETINKQVGILTWSEALPKRITRISLNNGIVGNFSGFLDCSNFTELRQLSSSKNQLTGLNLTSCNKLQKLVCRDNGLTNLDLSGCVNLKSLYCGNNKLENLDLSNCPKLEELYCEDNRLTTLDLSKNNQIIDLSCYSNNFKFSTLPRPNSNIINFYYSPQNTINDNLTKLIDLSDEYLIAANKTNYDWYDSFGADIKLEVCGNGKFLVDNNLQNQALRCKMTNSTYPKLALDYNVKLDGCSTDINTNSVSKGFASSVLPEIWIDQEIRELNFNTSITAMVEIVSLAGQVVTKNKLNSNNRMGLQSVPAGIYIVKIIDDRGNVITQKIALD